MAKDQTVVGITGKPVPKPGSAKKQYELEKKRRQEKHLGKNVGGTQYKSDVNPYYNPRQRTFEEFMLIAEGIGMTMASSLGNPPPLSKRMKLKRVLIGREIEKETEKNKKRKFSGKAASETNE
jgi:hypothetical protein